MMKKAVIFVCFLMCVGFQMSAQDATAIKEIQRLTLENDSLRRRVETVRKTSNERIAVFVDSLTRLNNEYRTLNGRVLQLQDDLEKERKKAEKIKDVKAERDSLMTQNTALQIRLDKEKKEQFDAGRKSVLGRIEQTYSSDFDVLVQSTSLKTVQRDLPFVEDATIKKKMQDLQSYFEAKQVLSEKYDELKVVAAQSKIKSLSQTNAVKALGESLENYKFSFDALRETINKIKERDQKFIANDDYSEKLKMKEILAELSDYFYNYSFDFAEYPYLSGIVMEIINRKQKDANADISDLMEEPVKPNSNARIKPVKP